MLHHFLPDLFFTPRGILSDDEDDDKDDMDTDGGDEKAGVDSTPATDSTTAHNTDMDKPPSKSDSNKDKSSPVKDTPLPPPSQPMMTEDEIKKEPPEEEGKEEQRPLMNGSLSEEEAHRDEIPANDDRYTLFFVNNNWYLFLRLHQLLCERLHKISQHAVRIAEEESKCKRERKESTAIALRLKAPSEVEPEDYYPYFLDRVKDLLDGNMEGSSYEDTLREIFGIHAYIAFTMDKLVQNLVRQLQHLVVDDICIQSMDLFTAEKKHGSTGGYITTAHQRFNAETTYQRKAEQLMADENCFKVIIYKNQTKIMMELLDTEQENSDEPVEVEKWSEYVEKYISSDIIPAEMRDHLSRKPVFLPRNIRQYRQHNQQQQEKDEALEASKYQPPPPAATNNIDEENKGDNQDLDEDGTMVNSDVGAMGEEVKKIPDDMDIMDNTECKFNVNSYKLVYVINSESCLYKRNALRKARQSHRRVSMKLHNMFSAWTSRWVEENVSSQQAEDCQCWLMGDVDGLKDQTTILTDNNSLMASPYYPYNRYHVRIHEREKSPAQESDMF